MNRIIKAAAVAATAALPLTACASHSTTHSVKKIESTIKANPAALRAEHRAQLAVEGCITKIGLIHLVAHPFKAGTRLIACAAPANKRPAVEHCVSKGAKIGKGALSKDETLIANCLVTTKAIK